MLFRRGNIKAIFVVRLYSTFASKIQRKLQIARRMKCFACRRESFITFRIRFRHHGALPRGYNNLLTYFITYI